MDGWEEGLEGGRNRIRSEQEVTSQELITQKLGTCLELAIKRTGGNLIHEFIVS